MAIREVHWRKNDSQFVETTEDVDVALREGQRIVFKGSSGEVGSAAAELFYDSSSGKLSFHNPNGQTVTVPESSSGNATGYVSVAAGSTANVTLSSLIPTATLDNVTLALDDLVLIKDQTSSAENGVYAITAVGAVRASGYTIYDVLPGILVVVQSGTTNSDTLWLCTSNKGGAIDVTAIAFSQQIVSGEMLKANNLSDVTNTATARTNLGLGTMAVATATDYLAKADNLSGLADTATARTNLSVYSKAEVDTSLAGKENTITAGTTAQYYRGDKTFATLNAAAVSLGNVTNDAQLKIASNLADLADTATARTNLALGSVDNTSDATKNAAAVALTNKDLSSTTNTYRAASATVTGAVELATIAETDTGTDATRAITPDGLAGSNTGKEKVSVQVTDGSAAIATGTGQAYLRIPTELAGMDLVDVNIAVTAPSTTGNISATVYRGRQASPTSAHTFVNMLTTDVSVDATEYDSKDATTAAVIDTANDDVAEGDIIRFDITGVGTAPTAVLIAELIFQLP